MSLSELLENPIHNFRIEVGGEALQAFALSIAETTARRIIAEINVPDKPLPEKEVCKQLNKTRQTMAKYRKQGKVRYNRIGREIYYLPSQFSEDIKNF